VRGRMTTSLTDTYAKLLLGEQAESHGLSPTSSDTKAHDTRTSSPKKNVLPEIIPNFTALTCSPS
jgi:hypothetical protein